MVVRIHGFLVGPGAAPRAGPVPVLTIVAIARAVAVIIDGVMGGPAPPPPAVLVPVPTIVATARAVPVVRDRSLVGLGAPATQGPVAVSIPLAALRAVAQTPAVDHPVALAVANTVTVPPLGATAGTVAIVKINL